MPRNAFSADRVSVVQGRIRALLRAEFASDHPAVLCSALSYELASVLAEHADSQTAAVEAIWRASEVMEQQLQAFGVGKPHP